MKRLSIVGGLIVLVFTAGCGSATDTTSGSVIMNGGGGSGGGTAGTGFTPIGTGGGGAGGTAGAATAGSSGATTIAGSGGSPDGNGGSGAASGSGGSGGQAPTGVPGYPSGPVYMCFGKGCPLGECDNDMFFEPTACSTLYTADIGPTSSYCKASETGSYCIEVVSGFDPDFSVSCANGVATVMKCNSGCGSFGTAAYQCLDF